MKFQSLISLKSLISIAALVALSGQVAAQGDDSCGEQPVQPDLVDGAQASMDELVANSEEVNAFIAAADEFLDCSEVRYKKLSGSKMHREQLGEQIKSLTTARNDIGDDFNAQVAAYKAANP